MHHFIHFAYTHIRNYSGKMSKSIQNYQGREEALLCEFAKVELIQCGEVFQGPSWDVSHFTSFNSCQEHLNEVEHKGFVQKNNNLMLSIFDHFYLMMWWESKARLGSASYPFEEETDHSKIPQVLLGKLAQLKVNFEKNMPGTTNKMKKMTPTDYEY